MPGWLSIGHDDDRFRKISDTSKRSEADQAAKKDRVRNEPRVSEIEV